MIVRSDMMLKRMITDSIQCYHMQSLVDFAALASEGFLYYDPYCVGQSVPAEFFISS